MATSQGHFKCIDHKPINLIKCLQELGSSYIKFSFLNTDTYQWQGFKVIIILININLLKNYTFKLFAAAIFFYLLLARSWFIHLTFIKFSI